MSPVVNKKRAFTALLWSAAGQFGATGISTFFVLIFARYVSVEDFGVFAIAGLLSSLSAQLSGLGLNTALVQRDKLNDTTFSVAFWITFAGATALAVVISISAEIIASLFSSPQLAKIIPLMMLGMIMVNISSLKAAILRREINMKSLANRTIAANLIGGAIATPLAISGYGVYALVTQYLAASALTLGLTILLTGWRARLRFHRSTAYELLHYGVPVMKADFLSVFNMESPKFFIGLFLGTAAVGFYSMASRLLNMLLMIFAATLSNVAFPIFSETNRHTPQRLKELYVRILRLAVLVYVPVFVLLALLSADIVVFTLGQSWVQAGDVTAILCLAGIPLSLGYLNGAVAMAFGQPRIRYKSNLIGSLIGTTLLMLMSPFGIVAAGSAVFLRVFISESLLTGRIMRHFSISLQSIFLMLKPPAIGAIGILLVSWLAHTMIVPEQKSLGITIMVIIGIAVYTSLVFIFDRLVIAEIRSLLQSWRKT